MSQENYARLIALEEKFKTETGLLIDRNEFLVRKALEISENVGRVSEAFNQKEDEIRKLQQEIEYTKNEIRRLEGEIEEIGKSHGQTKEKFYKIPRFIRKVFKAE